MLTITQNAGAVVTDLVARNNVSTGTGGIRISERGDDQFAVAIAEAPAETDIIAETGGARVYMEQPVAVVLDDKVLDARPTDDGGVAFVISAQTV